MTKVVTFVWLAVVASLPLLGQGRQDGAVALAEHVSSNLVLDSVECLERATANNIKAGDKAPAEKASKFCQTSVKAEVKRSTEVANEVADATKASKRSGVVLPGGIGFGWSGSYYRGGYVSYPRPRVYQPRTRRTIGRRPIGRR